jgi:hypothetical protein
MPFLDWQYPPQLYKFLGHGMQMTRAFGQVVAAGPRDMRMYYHSFDPEKEKWIIGLATSDDGFRWNKRGPMFEGSVDSSDFDGRGAAACHVIKDSELKQYAPRCFLPSLLWYAVTSLSCFYTVLHNEPLPELYLYAVVSLSLSLSLCVCVCPEFHVYAVPPLLCLPGPSS